MSKSVVTLANGNKVIVTTQSVAEPEITRETAPQVTEQAPMLDPQEFNILGLHRTPEGLSPGQSAIQTAKRGAMGALGSFVPGGEITAQKPELAGRTAGAVLAPVGSLTGLAGEKIGREVAPEGKEDIGQLIGGLAGGIGGEAGVAGIRKLLTRTPGAIINAMVKPKAEAFKYGKNPGQTVSKLGIVGNSLEDLGQNINNVITTKMDDLASMLKSSKNATKRISYKAALSVIDDTIDDLSKAKGTNKSIIAKIQTFKDDLLALTKDKAGKFKNTLTSLTPEEAVEIKRVTGKQAKWTATDTPPEFQSLIHKIYHSMRTSMEDVIPATRAINDDIANLIGAQRAIPSAIGRGQKMKLPISGRGLFTGIGGTVISGGNPLVGLGAMAAEKALSAPATGTRIARGLAKFAGNKGRLLAGLLK